MIQNFIRILAKKVQPVAGTHPSNYRQLVFAKLVHSSPTCGHLLVRSKYRKRPNDIEDREAETATLVKLENKFKKSLTEGRKWSNYPHQFWV
jgi:hypothetical protein